MVEWGTVVRSRQVVGEMVRVVPNGAQLYGSVREVRPLTAERCELVIDVERAEDVAGLANLLLRSVGDQLAVLVRGDAVERLGLRPGEAITCRAERVGPRAVVVQPQSLSRR